MRASGCHEKVTGFPGLDGIHCIERTIRTATPHETKRNGRDRTARTVCGGLTPPRGNPVRVHPTPGTVYQGPLAVDVLSG